jgi:nucleoid DNA-binding protein
MEYTNTMNEVQIRDFGTFRKVAREYKIGGKEGKTYVIRFSPSKIFKKMINE